MALAACVCQPDRHQLKSFASTTAFADQINRCQTTGDCAPLCFSVFSIDVHDELMRCRIVDQSSTGVHVAALVETPETCAVDDDIAIDIDGDGYDDGDGSYDDGDGGYDDGDGGYDDGSDTGDDPGDGGDGGDTGGGDDSGDGKKHAPTSPALRPQAQAVIQA